MVIIGERDRMSEERRLGEKERFQIR